MKRLISSFECSKSAQRNIDVDMIGLPEKPNGIYVKKMNSRSVIRDTNT